MQIVLQEKLGRYAHRVDRENGVIRDVLVCGLHSAKGHDYEPAALREAMPQYEGAPVHFDHVPPGERRLYKNKAGTIRNVRFVEGQGLRADLHLNQKNAQYEQVMWDAENNPAGCGLSHDTRGSVVNRGGRRKVNHIEQVLGVDIVSRPATVRGLYESDDDREEAPDEVPPASAPLAERVARFCEDRDGQPVPYTAASTLPLAKRIARFAQQDRACDALDEDEPADVLQEAWSEAARRAAALSRAAHRKSGQLVHHSTAADYLAAGIAHRAAAEASNEAADEMESQGNLTRGQRRVMNGLRLQAKYHEMAARHHLGRADVQASDADRVTAESLDEDFEGSYYEADDRPLSERIQKYAVRDRHAAPEPYDCLEHVHAPRELVEDSEPEIFVPPPEAPLQTRIRRFVQQ